MHAKETKLQEILEGTKQYVVPLFQRTYSWTKTEWEFLWKDLVELYETENPRTHFIGSIVSMPAQMLPEGVSKFLLIDGQQRLTTIFILLALLRDRANEDENQEFADEINNTLLANPYKKGDDYYKLLPTQVDRQFYKNLIQRKTDQTENPLKLAYDFFDRKLKQNQFENEKLKKIITSYFSVVSIVLDLDDNPHLVFESLNAKGRPLTQADLIRNYFFMRIHMDRQDEIYNEYWTPMQKALNEHLTEYIRHFLMKNGNIIKQTDVYQALKERVAETDAIDYLKDLKKFSLYYQHLIDPAYEPDTDLQKHFRRLNRIGITTVYPLLLNFYDDYRGNRIAKDDFVAILKILENYLIRRFVCNIPTHGLNKIFPTVYPQLTAKYSENFVEGLKRILQSKGYPKDNEFYQKFKESRFYSGSDRRIKTKLILEILEENFGHKEATLFENLSIEHVMPQTLSEHWQSSLGENWEETHEFFLHTIGNLTLTAYNSELDNDDFATKKRIYAESHLELNGYFAALNRWTRTEIESRADVLAKQALQIWNYFGQENSVSHDSKEVTGTSPVSLRILGQHLKVQNWRDVLEQTLNTILDLEPEKFGTLAQGFPRYLGKDKNKFRAIRQLRNNYFVEVNLSAQNIQRFCQQAIEAIELTDEDWRVETLK